MKKTLLCVVCLFMAVLVCACAFAEAPDALQQLAAPYLPEGVEYLSRERDDGLQELKFWSEKEQATYEVKIDADTNEVKKVSMEVRADRGSRNVTLTEDDVRKAVATLFPEATVDSIRLERDDGLQEYEARFTAPGYSGQIKLNPETGAVLEYEVDYFEQKAASAAAVTGPVTREQAEQIAMEKLGGGRVTEIEKDRDDGRTVYEGSIYKDGVEYEFEIDADTGKILKWERD